MSTICQEEQYRYSIKYSNHYSRARGSRCWAKKVKYDWGFYFLILSFSSPLWSNFCLGQKKKCLVDFRQKALRALEDRMKAKETTNESWPEIEETNPVEKNKPNLADIHSNSTITTSQHDKIESTQVYLNDEQTTDDNQW